MPVALSRGGAVLGFALLLLLGGMSAAAAQGAHPFGVPESGAGMGGPGWLANFFGQVSIWQSHFYRQLTGAVRAWQADGGAAWTLIGLSFAYGVFHALSPGHGKAVISSYVLANRQTARNGALLALASALIQALVAIVLVAVLALVFNATAATMNQATRWLELASYALVTLLGAWLVWVKAIRPLLPGRRQGAVAGTVSATASTHAVPMAGAGLTTGASPPRGAPPRGAPPEGAPPEGASPKGAAALNAIPVYSSAASVTVGLPHHRQHHHHHHHHDDCGCGHAHVPAPEQVAGSLSWRRAASAILAVGLRPCSGALIVLVFALSQGFFMAGVASALAMGAGTGLTVAALACLAVAAGGAATRVGQRLSSKGAARLRYSVEALAAMAVLLLGVMLLGGMLAGGG
ncbi:MAG: nickel/cobalt transporter [Achromobacter sp.]|uniref:nickel/cobalt transporter n=1 Tax=Achromobacter sp. TaxID=134375 RepID=UPI0029ACF1C2|nr:nickel/cobalt transporter [Achromobacter sp.]MDX3984919.1 nickel/cobalt transporter [Achromobacter sp.]